MKAESQTSIHLLLASVASVFSVILSLVTVAMSWEIWVIPLAVAGVFAIWFLHIGRIGSDVLYENLCAGVIMVEFFFFGVHRDSLFEIPMVACAILLVFSFLDRKRLLYITAALYVLELFYHFLFLHTIVFEDGAQDIIRLGLGVLVTAGAVVLGRYRINKMRDERVRFQSIFAQLETAGRQNADFLSNVSHELRTPINMVIGISEVSLGKELPPEIREDIQSIKMAGKRLSSQINNILDYTEIVEGTLTAAKENYRITSVIHDVITTTAAQNSRRQLEMVFDVDPKMPAVLIGDAEKISHVLKILLENSIKFTEDGGINVCFGFRRESYGINLMIDIYDTGVGMTSSQLAQMFDDFYQVDSGSRRYVGGLGLGIPIARGLLQAMGGFVHFASKGQQGMQVNIAIPQGVEDDTPGMALDPDKKFCIACYFRPERYTCDEVRRFYDNMILHLVEGLGVEGYQAHNFEGLAKLQREHDLTHVFIVQSVYEEERSYYEELAKEVHVVVIADSKFVLDAGSRLQILRKPFFALSVVNILNGQIQGNAFEKALATGHRSFSCAGVRVLAVDDEEMNLVVAKGVLGSYGMKVDTCLSGRAAVERCRDTAYDIIFLDHMMPGFDGVETLRRIREINNGMYKELPVVALTANTISGAREMFRSEGFTEFIPKPIERAVLERVLRRVLPERCLQNDPGQEGKDIQPGSGQEAQVLLFGNKQGIQPENMHFQGIPLKDMQEALPSPMEGIQDTPSSLLEGMHMQDTLSSLPEGAQGTASGSSEGAQGTASGPSEGAQGTVSGPSEGVQEILPGLTGGAQNPDLPYDALVGAGINVEMGLDYCCGEEEFYLEMLRMFYGQGAEKEAEIASLYESENWGDYAIKVHALKSTSLTIGAEQLSGNAKLLEQAGKNRDLDYIHENHAKLLQMYQEVRGALAGL